MPNEAFLYKNIQSFARSFLINLIIPKPECFLKIAVVLEESYRMKLVPMVAIKDSVSEPGLWKERLGS